MPAILYTPMYGGVAWHANSTCQLSLAFSSKAQRWLALPSETTNISWHNVEHDWLKGNLNIQLEYPTSTKTDHSSQS